nr:MAG TPA: hypothetical protein [Caudoviricetes sp.]
MCSDYTPKSNRSQVVFAIWHEGLCSADVHART